MFEPDRMTKVQRATLYRCLLNGDHDTRDIFRPCRRCLLENDDIPQRVEYAGLLKDGKVEITFRADELA